MKLINAEEHISTEFANQAIMNYLAAHPVADAATMATMAQSFKEGLTAYAVTQDELQDIDDNRLAYMDEHHIDMQILSYGDATTNPDLLPSA